MKINFLNIFLSKLQQTYIYSRNLVKHTIDLVTLFGKMFGQIVHSNWIKKSAVYLARKGSKMGFHLFLPYSRLIKQAHGDGVGTGGGSPTQ